MNTLQVVRDRILFVFVEHTIDTHAVVGPEEWEMNAQVAGNRWAARLRDREGKSVFCGNARNHRQAP